MVYLMRNDFVIFIKLSLICLLTVSIPSISIAETKSAPAWTSGSSDEYPSSQYLVGVGSSHSQERAKEKARTDLVKTIKIKIDASTSMKERVILHATNTGKSEDVHRTYLGNINTSTTVEMKNIRIEDTWYNSNNEQYYALAILSRSQASMDLTHEMEQLNEETSRHLTRANNRKDLFDKIIDTNKAILNQVHRNKLKSYLAAIDTTKATNALNKHDADNLQAEKLKLQRQISLGVNTKGNGKDSRPLALYAKGGLSALGYKPIENNQSQYVLDVMLDKEKAILKDNL